MQFQNEIKTGTKKQKSLVYAHDSARAQSIYACYARPSDFKERAWHDCLEKKYDLSGFDMKVNSYNTYMFTASFLFADPDTGVIRLYTITKYCDYVCDYI